MNLSPVAFSTSALRDPGDVLGEAPPPPTITSKHRPRRERLHGVLLACATRSRRRCRRGTVESRQQVSAAIVFAAGETGTRCRFARTLTCCEREFRGCPRNGKALQGRFNTPLPLSTRREGEADRMAKPGDRPATYGAHTRSFGARCLRQLPRGDARPLRSLSACHPLSVIAWLRSQPASAVACLPVAHAQRPKPLACHRRRRHRVAHAAADRRPARRCHRDRRRRDPAQRRAKPAAAPAAPAGRRGHHRPAARRHVGRVPPRRQSRARRWC